MPKTKPKTVPDDKEQSERFMETARKVGANRESSAADELLGRLAKQPPQARPKAKKGKGSA
jgi:hypothetical protein